MGESVVGKSVVGLKEGEEGKVDGIEDILMGVLVGRFEKHAVKPASAREVGPQ